MLVAEKKMNGIYMPTRPGDESHFIFEADFVEDNIRCIPMIVRFKLDACGIKLKLGEWSKFKEDEKRQLAELPCVTDQEIFSYRKYVQAVVLIRASHVASTIAIEAEPSWANLEMVDDDVQEKASEFGWYITLEQWQSLSNLQRFALVKLKRPGHENRNFPVAMKEFGIAE